MAKLTILEYPDPRLRTKAAPVERVGAELGRVIDDMFETMYDAPGIGLAAIQIGEPIRLLVIDLAKEGEPRAPQVFINPQIVAGSDDRSVYEEGCLSIPEQYAEVTRPASVRMAWNGRTCARTRRASSRRRS